ncbi:MAG: hypothetical protein R3Y35_07180 [Clostridia bacterium]
MRKNAWIPRKTTDKKKVAYFKKYGHEPIKVETKKGVTVYSFCAEETEVLNIAWKALEN